MGENFSCQAQSLGFPYALSLCARSPSSSHTQAGSVASSSAHMTGTRSLGLTEAAGQGAPGGRRSKVGHEHSSPAWPGAAGRCQSLRSGSQITAHPGKSSSKASPSEEPSWLSVVIVVVAALSSHPHPTFSSAVPLPDCRLLQNRAVPCPLCSRYCPNHYWARKGHRSCLSGQWRSQ